MGHPFDIYFDPLGDRQPRALRVTRVLTPCDRFTGQIVTAGITARIAARQAQARRTLGGHLFFEGPAGEAPCQVVIDTGNTGYFAPDPLDFPTPQAFGDPDARPVLLDLKPERVEDGSAAIIRGAVRFGGQYVAGARVTGTFPGTLTSFETRTNDMGSFALRLRLPPTSQAGGQVDVPFGREVDLIAAYRGAVSPAVSPRPVVRDFETLILPTIDLP